MTETNKPKRAGGGEKEIRFFVPGEPKGKGRPRFTQKGHAYTPETTINYENMIKTFYNWTGAGMLFAKHDPIRINVTAYFKEPVNVSKKRRKLMEAAVPNALPLKKPDGDNILKIIADALNGLAYYDDAQIVEWHFRKQYGADPGVEVELSIIEGEP